MSRLTRYNPFSELTTIDHPFREIFDQFSRSLGNKPTLINEELAADIRLDVTESDKAYSVRAEIPGAKKEEIKLSVDGNRVSISAEIKREKEQKTDDKVLARECYYGSVYRSFTLAQNIDEAEVNAKYNDGVLTLVLPKKGGSTARQVTIQ